eukprot:TRINITY_DN9240_c0_g1_i1.p1 TRINITY_DN9240_c0_g1~~TRINITY_DN9240_c0_g1_i1.p1  ORF type:complete len:325 (+),score=104.92 TRINITY_DN9240_c0_g1_i1:39-977(+)
MSHGKVYNNITELIGNTPLVRAEGLEKMFDLQAKILLKLEYLNPGFSVKDRIALKMIQEARKDGSLLDGQTIVEATSGNTGIGLCMVGSALKHPVVIVMPENMSEERKLLMKYYGAELILTPATKGMAGAVEVAQEYARTNNGFLTQQFSNPANPLAHIQTAREVYADTDGEIDYFVAGVGTGGTISGVGKELKKHDSSIQIIGIEPAESAVLSGEPAGKHLIQGIGAGFIPENYDSSVVDEIIKVKSQDAIDMSRLCGVTTGMVVGISSGSTIKGAIELAKRDNMAGKTIVVICASNAERYLSTVLFEHLR